MPERLECEVLQKERILLPLPCPQCRRWNQVDPALSLYVQSSLPVYQPIVWGTTKKRYINPLTYTVLVRCGACRRFRCCHRTPSTEWCQTPSELDASYAVTSSQVIHYVLLCYQQTCAHYGRPLSVAWAKSMLCFANAIFYFFMTALCSGPG